MRGQELRDRGSAPVGIMFDGNRSSGNVFAGVGVSLTGRNAFKSGRKLGMQRDRTGGLSNG